MLNFQENNRQKIFVTADTHWHHNKDFVWKSRGHASLQEHDEFVITKINEVVMKDDILFHLGDLCLNTKLDEYEQLISRINCQNIYMLFGNHPNPHFKNIYKLMVKKILGENYTEDSEVYPLRYKNIIYMGHYLECIINGQFVVICHYPIYVFNEMMHGSWMLSGHSHYGCNLTKAENPSGKILDVGWDGPNKPWTFDQIRNVMNSKRFIELDEHHK